MSIINTLNKDTHYFTLDLHQGATLAEPLNFKQYDHNSRVLAIELTVHNSSLDLTDARVDIWVYKADGHLVQKAVDKANIDLENSMVMIPLTAQMLSVLPEIECEIVVTYANKSVLSFPTFKVQIEDSNVDVETIVSTSEFNLFYDALYRMEEWMRDYLEKYRIVDASFTQKLAEIDEEKIRIIEEFRALSGDLVQQDAVRFEELKQMTIGEFAEWFKEAKQQFAYAGREIEKRFNELWEKCNVLNLTIEDFKEEIDLAAAVIDNNLKIIQELTDDAQEKYAEVVALCEDGATKLTEMQNTFNADQSARQTAFDNAQLQRTTDFEKAQSDRTKAYEDEKTARNSAYNTAEANRNTLYSKMEENRDTLFDNAERERQQSYSEKESARILAEQNRVNAENQRVENENQRIADFNAMREEFNIALQYRLLEE